MNDSYPIIADEKYTGAQANAVVLAPTAGKSWVIHSLFLITDAEATLALLHGTSAAVTDAAGSRLRRGKFAAESGIDSILGIQLPVGEGLYFTSDAGNADLIIAGDLR